MVFLADLLDSTLQIFSLKNKIHKIWLKITGSAHSQTTNKLVNKAANDSSRVSGQDREKQSALSESIRLQDLEDSARSQAQKKINNNYSPKRRWLAVSVYRGRVSGEVNTHH